MRAAPISRIKRLSREPLVHFLLIGAALFLVFGLTQGPGGKAPKRIVVDASRVEQLAAQFSRTWLRPPTPAELSGLIASHVRDEVYYREAVAMGLDQNDSLIRQRMRQKLEFLLEDLNAEEASDEALTAFLQQNPDRFRAGPRVSFQQVYLNPEKRPDLLADAQRMLVDLNAGAAPESVGDPTLVQSEFSLVTLMDVARSFGDLFALEVDELTPGEWTGPIYSALGGHLVRVSDRREGRLPELAEIRSQVEREYLAKRRQELAEASYRKLLEGYEIVIEPTAASGAKGAPTTETAQAPVNR
jgi:parvulin-like peptidyl-prolyl isomerase